MRHRHLTPLVMLPAFGRDVARALAELHRRGIVHRDVKPGNVIVAGDGDDEHARLIDFGLASATGDGVTLGRLVRGPSRRKRRDTMTRVLPVGIAWAMASAAIPASAAEPETTVAVEVDVSALPDEDFTRWLKDDLVERQKSVLRDGGIDVALDAGADADAIIRVTVSRYGELGVHYRASIALFEKDADTPKVEHMLTCELCKDSMLVTKVSEEVARMSGRFMYEREEAVRAEPESAEGAPPGSQPQDVAPERKVRRVGGAGWAGIGFTVAAAGFGTGGVVELTRPATRGLDSGRDEYETFTRPRELGVALVAVGAGLLVAGAVLVAVDQSVLLERRRRRAPRLSLLPSFSTTGVGLSWSGRF